MANDSQLQLCLKELDFVQDTIRRFDQNGLTIKSWSLTTWSLISVYGLQNNNPILVWIGAFTVFVFGFTEFIYRRFQMRFIQRSAEIEAILGNGDLSIYKYSLNRAATTVDLRKEIKFAFRQPQFLVYYLSLMVVSLILAIYLWSNGITPKP